MGPDQYPVNSEHLLDDPTYPRRAKIVKSLSDATAQTPGMERFAAIDRDTAGARSLWFGRVKCPPGLNSGPHHHGPAETAGHMLSGDHIRVYFGKNYEEYVDYYPGDYLFVPAYMPHIEVNMSDTVEAEFIAARSPGNIVFNLDEGDVDRSDLGGSGSADETR
jgi:uncharacterized RmlC-like cupin family protein